MRGDDTAVDTVVVVPVLLSILEAPISHCPGLGRVGGGRDTELTEVGDPTNNFRSVHVS